VGDVVAFERPDDEFAAQGFVGVVAGPPDDVGGVVARVGHRFDGHGPLADAERSSHWSPRRSTPSSASMVRSDLKPHASTRSARLIVCWPRSVLLATSTCDLPAARRVAGRRSPTAFRLAAAVMAGTSRNLENCCLGV